MVSRPRATFALFALIGLFASACEPAAAPTSAPEPLPPSGLPASTEALLFGTSTRCQLATECASGACVFGACAGLITVDEPALAAVVGARLRDELARTPGLAERLVPTLSVMVTDKEAGLPFRGRAARTLAEIGSPAALTELERRLPESTGSLADLIAVLLANHGRPAGLGRVVELSRSQTTARSVEALRALGGLKDAPPDARDVALVELLSALSPDVHLEESRAAVDGLARLNDPRALTPLRRFLVAGPDGLAHEAARAMRALASGLGGAAGAAAASLGPDPRRWDAHFAANPPPAPPAFEPRRHDSEDDLDLPTP